jgi:DNA polymerase III delta prime subunit
MKNNLKKSLWVERYRPQSIRDVIFQDQRQQKFFMNIIESGDLPNLLLQGVRGTGKTTISQALMTDLNVDQADILKINCSNEKIDALREKVYNFAMTFPLGKFKVVRLEEFDYMSLDGQALLRSLMEDASGNCRFIATCNYINKVMPELRSRFQEVCFKAPDQDKLTLRMAEMLDGEAVDYEPTDLINYVAVGYPDIRKTIQLLQQNVQDKKLLPSSGAAAQEADWKFGLLDCLSKGDFKRARKIVCESATREEHEDVFRFLYENLEKMKLKDKEQAVITIAEYLYRHSIVADTEINLAACFIELGRT